jgi:hypothetical protein
MSLILNGTDGLSDVDGTAATPAIRGTDANTGIFFPAADTIAFSEGGTEQMRLDSAGNLQMNSGYGSVATAYGCRSWVNFDGGATPPTVRASGNVSSVTRAATGTWDISFTTSLTDANYAVGFSVQPSVTNAGSDSFAENLATGSYRIKHFEDGTLRNSPTVLSLVTR